MSTIQFNSKGQRIEELDSHLEKVDNPLSLNSSEPFQKVDNSLAPPFQKVEEDEILAWCEYYLHSKKIERKLSHIYFPSTFSTFSTFKKGSA